MATQKVRPRYFLKAASWGAICGAAAQASGNYLHLNGQQTLLAIELYANAIRTTVSRELLRARRWHLTLGFLSQLRKICDLRGFGRAIAGGGCISASLLFSPQIRRSRPQNKKEIPVKNGEEAGVERSPEGDGQQGCRRKCSSNQAAPPEAAASSPKRLRGPPADKMSLPRRRPKAGSEQSPPPAKSKMRTSHPRLPKTS